MLVALGIQYARDYTLARMATQLERRRHDLLVQNQRLRGEIQRLLTDDRYIERLAREQLGLVRPGEVELVIVPPEPAHPESGARGAGSRAYPQVARAQGPERTPTAARVIATFLAHLRDAIERAVKRIRG